MKRHAHLLALSAILSLSACQKPYPESRPENRGLIMQPGYVVPTGWQTECVGYHLVDLPGEFETAMGTLQPGKPFSEIEPRFSEELVFERDRYNTGEASIQIRGPTTRDRFNFVIPREV